MKNVTLAIDDAILAASRDYAQKHQMTLNGLVRHLLERTVCQNTEARIEELFRLMDAHPGQAPKEYRFRREDAYDV